MRFDQIGKGKRSNADLGSQVGANGLATSCRTPRISVVYRAQAWAFGVTRDEVRPNRKGKAVKRRSRFAGRCKWPRDKLQNPADQCCVSRSGLGFWSDA